MATPSIIINAKPKKSVAVSLVGVDYMIKPPKSALLLVISEHAASKGADNAVILSKDISNILKLMFGKSFGAVKERLESPDDDLDLEHIFEAVEAVTEDKTGSPTS